MGAAAAQAEDQLAAVLNRHASRASILIRQHPSARPPADGYAELVQATLALEDRPAGVLVARHAAALGQTGSPSVAAQRIDRNVALASASDMRATDARESVRALAERRKCCVTVLPSGSVLRHRYI